MDNNRSPLASKWAKQTVAVSRRGPDRDGEPDTGLHYRPYFRDATRQKQADARLPEPVTTGGKSSCYDTVY